MDILCNLRKITEQKSAEKVLSQYFLVLKNIYYQIQDTALCKKIRPWNWDENEFWQFSTAF